jgi:hypothetical protein
MATEKQKAAARRNLEKARAAQTNQRRPSTSSGSSSSSGLSTQEKDRLPDNVFAFPTERKEPLTDASHVRNAIARFDQVEGVSDEERDQAWQRIRAAARDHDVDVSESDWHELFEEGKAEKH